MKIYPHPPSKSSKESINPEFLYTESDEYANEMSQIQAQQLQDDMINSVSSGDCTGLIPALPPDGDYEDYASLYSYLPPDVNR